jgi:TIR domain
MAQAPYFFVSYTSADRTWAEWVAWQLEQAGYQVGGVPLMVEKRSDAGS